MFFWVCLTFAEFIWLFLNLFGVCCIFLTLAEPVSFSDVCWICLTFAKRIILIFLKFNRKCTKNNETPHSQGIQPPKCMFLIYCVFGFFISFPVCHYNSHFPTVSIYKHFYTVSLSKIKVNEQFQTTRKRQPFYFKLLHRDCFVTCVFFFFFFYLNKKCKTKILSVTQIFRLKVTVTFAPWTHSSIFINFFSVVPLVVPSLPDDFAHRLLTFIVKQLLSSPHLEFYLLWSNTILTCHGQKEGVMAPQTLVALHQAYNHRYETIHKMWVLCFLRETLYDFPWFFDLKLWF